MSSQRSSRAVGPAILFGVFLLVVMASSLWLYWRATEKMVWSQQPATAAGLVDQLMLQVHWEGLETNDKFREQSNVLVEQLAGGLSESGVEATFLYRPDAAQYPESGPGRPANQFETDLIAQLMNPQADRGQQATPAKSGSPDNGRYYYYQPIYAKQECTHTCHISAPPGGVFEIDSAPTDSLAEGDLMAVAKISLPNNELRAAVNETRKSFLTVAIITTCLLMLGFCIVMRFVTVRNAPLKD